jgi:RHS repeat-associated protein
VALDPPPTATSTDAVPAVEFFLSLPCYAAKMKPPEKVPLRRFSGSPSLIKKEFDREGDVNGALGIQAYYFGARLYDQEAGILMGPDPAAQYWNAYSYVGGCPLVLVDPSGQNAVAGMLIGMAAGAVTGVVIAEATGGE